MECFYILLVLLGILANATQFAVTNFKGSSAAILLWLRVSAILAYIGFYGFLVYSFFVFSWWHPIAVFAVSSALSAFVPRNTGLGLVASVLSFVVIVLMIPAGGDAVMTHLSSTDDSVKTSNLSENEKSEIEERFTNYFIQYNRQLPVSVDEITTLNSAIFVDWVLTCIYRIDVDITQYSEDEIKNMTQEVRKLLPDLVIKMGSSISNGALSKQNICKFMELTGMKYRFIYKDAFNNLISVCELDYRDFKEV